MYYTQIFRMKAETKILQAKHIVADLKDKAIENQSELTCIGVTATVVGVAARVCGFKAGYAYAKQS